MGLSDRHDGNENHWLLLKSYFALKFEALTLRKCSALKWS